MEGVHRILRRWLAAEKSVASSAAADRSLSELMLVLPDIAPRPGFVERVIAAADFRPVPSHVPRPVDWAFRAVVTVCLALTATAVGSLSSLFGLAAERLSLAETVSGFARTFTVVVDFMAVLIAAGKLVAALYEALLQVLTAPPVAVGWLGALVFTTVFTTLTLRWLARLLSPLEESAAVERSSGYVSASG
jgi:hypothetical protein